MLKPLALDRAKLLTLALIPWLAFILGASPAHAQSMMPRGFMDPLVRACKETVNGNSCEKPNELIEQARGLCLESLKQNNCAAYAKRLASSPETKNKLATCSPQEICEGIDPLSSATFASQGAGEAWTENIIEYVQMVVAPFTSGVSQFGCDDKSIISKYMTLEGLPLPPGRDLASMDCREISHYVTLKQPEFLLGIQKKGGLAAFEKDPSRFGETEREHLRRAIEARTKVKGAFEKSIDAAMDKMKMVGACYKPSELATLKGYMVGSIMSPPGPGKANKLKKAAELAGLAVEEKALKEANELANEANVVKAMNGEEAAALKLANRADPEFTMTRDQMRIFDTINDEGFPKVGTRSASILASIDGGRKVEVQVRSMSGSKTQWMTRDEALRAIENSSIDSINIRSVEAAASKIEASTVAAKISGDLYDAGDFVHSGLVTYQNGVVGRVYGTRDMIQKVASQENVKHIELGTEGPSWLKTSHAIPDDQKKPTYHPEDIYRKQLNSSLVSTSKQSDVAGLTVYHGTIKENEASVRAGPKDYGRGFGGSGLYVAVKGNRELAEEYAAHAAQAPESRASYARSATDNRPINAQPIVLDGKVNPNKNYRVGTFQVTRDGVPDLAKGILPFNWADDPSLLEFLNKEFDILDLRGMQSNGLNMATDRFLVIKERAGSDAVIWDAAKSR